MRFPRKGILIRLLIYIPLLSYFGWAAYKKWSAEQTPAAPEIEGRTHTFTLPDGKSVEVVEISEEQARQMGYDPNAAAAPAEPPAKAPAAEEPKAPAPPPASAN